MKLLFKQRLFSWLDSYDIYDEAGKPVYTVKGKFSWGHCLKIFDTAGNEVGSVKELPLTFLTSKFDLYLGQQYLGRIRKEFTFFKPRFTIDFNGWHIDGDWLEWDYRILDAHDRQIAAISKELFNWTDTYVINVLNPRDALCALMLVLAIDAEKCSRD